MNCAFLVWKQVLHAVALPVFTVTHPRLQSQTVPLQFNPLLGGDMAVSLKNLNLGVPPPRLNFQPPRLPPTILKIQGGPSEEMNQSEVKVTILKRPDAVALQPMASKVQLKSTEDEGEASKEQGRLLKILKRPEVLPAEVDPSFSEESWSQNRVLVKSLKQREEEYAEARQRILGQLEAEVPSTTAVQCTANQPCLASVSELREEEGANVK